MHGLDRVPDLNTNCERALVGWDIFNECEMALFVECTLKCAPILIDNADIVRDAMFQQHSCSAGSVALRQIKPPP
jgi:hypothetical protein